MAVDYISVAQAVDRTGLRLVLSPGLPGPWSVAAKAVFDYKRIPYQPVAQTIGARDDVLRQWTGQDSAPVAMLDQERPRTRWYEILQLAERLVPEPRLLPDDEIARAESLGLLHTIAGEDGLGWNFRLHVMEGWEQALHEAGEHDAFMTRAQVDTMQHRYGDRSRAPEAARERMRRILRLLAARLHADRQSDGRYFLGGTFSAVDLYWVAFSNLVAPLSATQCPMPDGYRAMAAATGILMGDALDPILLRHRERILDTHLRAPLEF